MAWLRLRPRGANREAILAVIRSRPGVSVGEVANVVAKDGLAKNTTYVTISKLAKQIANQLKFDSLGIQGADQHYGHQAEVRIRSTTSFRRAGGATRRRGR